MMSLINTQHEKAVDHNSDCWLSGFILCILYYIVSHSASLFSYLIIHFNFESHDTVMRFPEILPLVMLIYGNHD